MTLAADRSISATLRSRRGLVRGQHRLAATERLLTEGGDSRIVIDRQSGSNRYGCPPLPDPAIAPFGSSTAASISTTGFAAADRLRRRLLRRVDVEASSRTYAGELERMRGELADLCGLSDLAGLDIVFAASGTDLHLFAAQLARGAPHADLLAVMVDAAETGSGVPAALAGRHFSACTALGNPATQGEAITGGTIDVVAVASRSADGTPRAVALVDAEIEAVVSQAAASGRRVLLTLVDVSKTGLVAPSPGCAVALRDRWPDAVELLVDACQFRLAPATLRAYLEHGFMVAVTGSKFLTGPAFSGALLFPDRIARRFRECPLDPAMGSYSARADWPTGWAAARQLGDVANFGLLLRWEAALAELRAFRRVPEAEATTFLAAFAQEVQVRLAQDPTFEALAVPALDRGMIGSATGWDRIPTIFPFLLRDRRFGALLDREATERVYRTLGMVVTDADAVSQPSVAELRCQVGQPVPCGRREGRPVGALRLCASARLVTEATAHGAESVIRRASAVLDKVALLAAIAS
jgi:hypothetical protein